jgi:lipoyl(octanoyl) transferase
MTSEPNVRWLGRIAFGDALELQEQAVAARRVNGEIVDEILLLEHEPVYTIGRTPDRSSLPSENSLPHPLFAINRGGQATYHGPGQLVGYPILNLKRYGQDLHRYLRWIEDVLIQLLAKYEIDAGTREGLTGVWVEQRKIASIGVGVRHWITMHGFALNVCGDLEPFASIVPCGISGVEMTSIEKETGRAISVIDVAKNFEKMVGESLEALAVRSEASVAPNA